MFKFGKSTHFDPFHSINIMTCIFSESTFHQEFIKKKTPIKKQMNNKCSVNKYWKYTFQHIGPLVLYWRAVISKINPNLNSVPRIIMLEGSVNQNKSYWTETIVSTDWWQWRQTHSIILPQNAGGCMNMIVTFKIIMHEK